jgi:hypothetical protein
MKTALNIQNPTFYDIYEKGETLNLGENNPFLPCPGDWQPVGKQPKTEGASMSDGHRIDRIPFPTCIHSPVASL